MAISAIIESAAESNNNLAGDLTVLATSIRHSTVAVRGEGPGGGSGTIWRADGLIITNAHVAREERAYVDLWDGRTLEAEVTARDPQHDLASLQVRATDLPAIPIGDSQALRVGELVLAVGNPLGVVGALSSGIIHALGPRNAGEQQRWVQADLRLAPGNSGGPMTNARGQVIGINSMIGGGLALAVPSNEVLRFLKVQQRPYLGIVTQPVRVQQDFEAQLGLLLINVEPGSPAERGGLLIGDVLVGVNGQRFERPERLLNALSEAGDGGTVQLDLLRGGHPSQRSIVVVRETRRAAA